MHFHILRLFKDQPIFTVELFQLRKQRKVNISLSEFDQTEQETDNKKDTL
jgi:hypothetical protein